MDKNLLKRFIVLLLTLSLVIPQAVFVSADVVDNELPVIGIISVDDYSAGSGSSDEGLQWIMHGKDVEAEKTRRIIYRCYLQNSIPTMCKICICRQR